MLDVAKLIGTPERFDFPSKDPSHPIALFAVNPTPIETVAAVGDAGMVYNEDGSIGGGDNVADALAMSRAYVALARRCITGAVGFPDWPERCRKAAPDGTLCLTDEAGESLLAAGQGDPAVVQIILRRVGEKLFASRLTEAEGNDSAPQPSGDTPESSGATPTPASSA